VEIDVLTCQHHVEHETGCPSCARDAVFDAAMALWKIEQRWRDTAGGVILEDEDIVAKHYEAERAFEEACRKAEDVKHA